MSVQFNRKATLLLTEGQNALDLSAFRFTFATVQQDVESPNNCSIRVYNISDDTLRTVQGEFSNVVLQAGYQDSYGVIFQGTIKQFRIGREGTETYLDILAADGDIGYTQATVSKTLDKGWKQTDVIDATTGSMAKHGLSKGIVDVAGMVGGTVPNPRGKVLFGMARTFLRNAAGNTGCTWNINDGKVNVIPVAGYLPGEAVVLTAATGLIGRPEQTNQGIEAKCLLNHKIVIGGLVKIDNRSINQTVQHRNAVPNLVYNKWAVPQFLASVATDGVYRVFVVEHQGDTRGQLWYTTLTCLQVDQSTNKVVAP